MKYHILIQETVVKRANVEVEVPVKPPTGWKPEDWAEASLDEKLEWLAQDQAYERSLWWEEDMQTIMLNKEELPQA